MNRVPQPNRLTVLWLLALLVLSMPVAQADELAALGFSINNGPRDLYRISPDNGGLDQSLTTSFRPPGFGTDVANLGLAYGGGWLWALGFSINSGPRDLYRIDPATGRIAQTLTTAFRPPGFGNDVIPLSLAYGDGHLWALGFSINNGPRPLYKIDPANGSIVQTLTTPFRPPGFGNDYANLGMAYGGGYLWALGISVNNGPRPLHKISPVNGGIVQTLTTTFRPPGFGNDVASLGLAYGNGHLWALGFSINNGPRDLYRINPASGSIDQTVRTPFRPPGFGTDIASLGLAYIGVGQLNLSADPANGGKVSGSGAKLFDMSVTVTAAAATGYRFVNWSEGGNVVSLSADYTFVVTGNRSLIANYTPITYTIATAAEPPDGGTTSGGGALTSGTGATLLAIPAEGFQFVDWSEGGSVVSTEPDYLFTVTEDRTLVAHFTPNVPQLRITLPMPGQVVISWVSPLPGWLLEESSGLGSDNWVVSTGPVTVTGDHREVRTVLLAGTHFFRLRYQ